MTKVYKVWLRGNTITYSTSKTELSVFKHPNKKINYEFRIKMNAKKSYSTNFVKCRNTNT